MASTNRGTAWEWGNSWWFVLLPWILMAWIGFAIAGLRTAARKYFAYAAIYGVVIWGLFYRFSQIESRPAREVSDLEGFLAVVLTVAFISSIIHPWVARGEYLRRVDARLRGVEYQPGVVLPAPNQGPPAPRPPTPTGADPFPVFGGRNVDPPVETQPRPAVHAEPPPSPFARPAAPPPPPVPGVAPAPQPSPFARPVPPPPPVANGGAAPPPPPAPGGGPVPPPPPVPGGSVPPPPPSGPKDGPPPPPPSRGRQVDF